MECCRRSWIAISEAIVDYNIPFTEPSQSDPSRILNFDDAIRDFERKGENTAVTPT